MTSPTAPNPSGASEQETNLAALQARLSVFDGPDDFDEMRSPLYWPTLSADEAESEWNSLHHWTQSFRARFPHAVKIPDCWYQHSDLVEALSALRDHERASYSSTAPPTAAIEWHRAFRDIETRMEAWIKRFTCTVPGRGHQPAPLNEAPPEAWNQFVHADISARHTRQIATALS